MKRFGLVSVLALTLVGCDNGAVATSGGRAKDAIKAAQAICADHDGVRSTDMVEDAKNDVIATCMDGYLGYGDGQ